MTRSFPRLLLLTAVALFLGACGAAATLPPAADNTSLASKVSEAVWYADKGDHPILAMATQGDSILVLPPGDDSSYVNGAFSINIPDKEVVLFTAKVGLPVAAAMPVVFSAYVQDGTNFPKLAEITAQPDGQLADFRIDLSRLRGRAVLLILAVSSKDQSPLSTSALWVEPKLLTP